MTALLNAFSFPMSKEQAEVIAIERGLDAGAEFDVEIGRSSAFMLSKADMIRNIVTMPNVSEGGVSISISDRKTLIGLANGIYSKYGEPLIKDENPTVTPIIE